MDCIIVVVDIKRIDENCTTSKKERKENASNARGRPISFWGENNCTWNTTNKQEASSSSSSSCSNLFLDYATVKEKENASINHYNASFLLLHSYACLSHGVWGSSPFFVLSLNIWVNIPEVDGRERSNWFSDRPACNIDIIGTPRGGDTLIDPDHVSVSPSFLLFDAVIIKTSLFSFFLFAPIVCLTHFDLIQKKRRSLTLESTLSSLCVVSFHFTWNGMREKEKIPPPCVHFVCLMIIRTAPRLNWRVAGNGGILIGY